MSKLALSDRVPRKYDAASIQDIVRQVEQQMNRLTEGAIDARHGAKTAAPTFGTWVKGDLVDNSSPTTVADSVADYVITGWVCTASGNPGTWKERRVLVEGITIPAENNPVAATQAQQEAGTNITDFTTPGRQHFHPGHPKAWLKCGITGNINASYNITSVTDAGIGLASIAINTNFSSVNYAIAAGVEGSSLVLGVDATSQTAGAFGLNSRDLTGTLTDPVSYYFIACGDQ